MNRLDVLTPAVPDVDVARRFSLDGLRLELLQDPAGVRWEIALDPGPVVDAGGALHLRETA
ncbi:hypothetical protein [Kineococcus sp. SYSU DK002]|uniref:hypothetical protein n=1 Tax=Kineococcus sp. SYSU DK002 TaxID=3383123 RepID=UPI003D7D40D2